jgi:hypothetical protein
MEKTSFEELPTDVETLIKNLQEMYCSGKTTATLALKEQVTKQGTTLKTNLEGGKLRNFLLQLKTVFCAKGDLQHQILVTQFIKEALSSHECEIFKAHLAAISPRIIPQKMKEVIYSDLK